MTQVKCPVCLEKIESSRLKPIDEWQDGWSEVRCIICKNEFKIAVEINPEISSDFDESTFSKHFNLEKFPDGVVKQHFNMALNFIAKNNQVGLKEGFDDEIKKPSFEFAIVHHQRVRRSLMPQDRKKVS